MTASGSSAIVLGATSLVGRFLVRRLAHEGVSVVAVSRSAHPDVIRVTWVRATEGSLNLPEELRAPVAFSALPVVLLPPALPELHARGVRRLIAFSTTSVFTKHDSVVGRERESSRRLAQAEQQVSEFCDGADIEWTILRPTLTYAEGLDRNVTRLARFAGRFGVLPLAGRGLGQRQPVHADDLAAGAMEAARSEASRNRDYNVPGGETLTYREMCERIFEGLSMKPRIIAIPSRVWALGTILLRPFLGDVSPAVGLRMSADLTFDSGPARRDFSWQPRAFHPRFEAPDMDRRR